VDWPAAGDGGWGGGGRDEQQAQAVWPLPFMLKTTNRWCADTPRGGCGSRQALQVMMGAAGQGSVHSCAPCWHHP
jgi:hypothetical protein